MNDKTYLIKDILKERCGNCKHWKSVNICHRIGVCTKWTKVSKLNVERSIIASACKYFKYR